MNKLRIGVILPDQMVPAWIRSMLERVKNSQHAEIAALAFAAGDALTLEKVGLFWLLAFVAYTAFNCWALRRR